MFKITKDGATVAMTEAPNYIKQAENGCFVLCPEAEATVMAARRVTDAARQGGRQSERPAATPWGRLRKFSVTAPCFSMAGNAATA